MIQDPFLLIDRKALNEMKNVKCHVYYCL